MAFDFSKKLPDRNPGMNPEQVVREMAWVHWLEIGYYPDPGEEEAYMQYGTRSAKLEAYVANYLATRPDPVDSKVAKILAQNP